MELAVAVDSMTMREIQGKAMPGDNDREEKIGIDGKYLNHPITIKKHLPLLVRSQPVCTTSHLKEEESLPRKVIINDHSAGDKSHPLFNVFKDLVEKTKFKWSEEAENAFQYLKVFLTELPASTAPIPSETLTTYLASSNEAIRPVLLADRDKR
ncbi:hypothetical protein Tco_0031912 [Tanacetum coccineum]